MNGADLEVVCRAGTDGSYDLIVEVVRPPPPGTVGWRGDPGVPRARLEAIAAELLIRFGGACEAAGVGLRLCFFRRLPDPFVITARVRAALAAASAPG